MTQTNATQGTESLPVAERSAATGVRGRAQLIERVTLAGGILGLLTVVLYAILYFQIDAWQVLASAGFVLLGVLCLIPAWYLARRRNFQGAGYWILFAIALAYGCGNLVWAGTAIYNAIGGVLLILLAAIMVRPRRWGWWVAVAVVYVVLIFLVDWLEPVERYDINESLFLSIYVPLVTAGLVLLTLWQVVRVFRLGNIRTRLLVAFVALALLPVIVLGVGVAIGGLQGVQQTAVSQLESVGVLKEAAINTWLEDLLIDLKVTLSGRQVLGNLTTVLQGNPGSQAHTNATRSLIERLNQVLVQTGRYEELFLVGPRGQVVVSTNSESLGETVANQVFFREGLEGPYVHRPIYSMADKRSYIYLAHPVVDGSGNVLGVLAGRADLDKLTEVMAQRTGLGATGQTYVVAFNQTLLTPARTGEFNVWVTSEGIDTAVRGETYGSGLYDDFRGVPVVGAYRWMPSIQSALIAEQEQSEAFRSIGTMLGIAAGVAVLAIVLGVGASLLITRSIATPLSELAETATVIAGGDLARRAPVERDDEVGELALAFNSMTAQMRALIETLEQRVDDRTTDLKQRSAYLAAAAEVGRAASSILETSTLMKEVVELIREEFGLYYVGLFLVDQEGEWAELQAGTGLAGQAMMAREHKLQIGGESMIGWSIANRQARIALEAGEDAVRLATPELPRTRSEAALPLRSRDQIIGALSVQHTEPEAFDQDTIVVFQTMADQVAVALDNARLFAERQDALVQVQRAYGELSREAWRDLLRTGAGLAYRSDEAGVTEMSEAWQPAAERAYQEGRLVRGDDHDVGDRRPLAIPIRVRGEIVGVLDTYKSVKDGEWTADEVALLEQIVEQLDVALETSRLHQEAQRRATREETIRRVTERMRRPRDVEAILQSTMSELTKALGVPRAYVRLGTESDLLGSRGNDQVQGETDGDSASEQAVS